MMSAFFSLSTYFKYIALQFNNKVILILDKFFLKYEGGQIKYTCFYMYAFVQFTAKYLY